MYKVMIVEDDPMVAAINRQYVELNQEFRVCGIFKNGKEGLDYLKQRGADLVILDYYMPLMNGREFLAAIREMEERPEVIMVTAAGEAETVRASWARASWTTWSSRLSTPGLNRPWSGFAAAVGCLAPQRET